LVINEKVIKCHNKFGGRSYKIKRILQTDSGKKLPQFYFEGIVPEGKSIVYDSDSKSFDSRYYGFIDYNVINFLINRLVQLNDSET
jgi:type IV secretory pathway protease TraF